MILWEYHSGCRAEVGEEERDPCTLLLVLLLFVTGRGKGIEQFYVVDVYAVFHIEQSWQEISLILILLCGHVIDDKFKKYIWVVSQENRAGMHLEFPFHIGGTHYFGYCCVPWRDMNGSR